LSPRPFLSTVAAALGGVPRCWSDVAVVRNVGPLQTAAPLEGDNISNRGFNAIVFATAGEATHFLKVRPLAHASFAREAAVTVSLAAQPPLANLVPASQSFVAGPARVLAQEFIGGTALDVVLRGRGRPAWHELAAEVLRSTNVLRAAIGELAVALGGSNGLAVLRPDLELLAGLGVDAVALRKLAARAAEADLPLRPQHGDFWPRNVLKTADGWRVLDYESCGQPAPPLFDVFHLVRGCADTAARGRRSWLSDWAAAGRSARPLADEVRRAAGSLNQTGIEAAFVAYQVTFVATLYRRGIARDRIEGRLRELAGLPALLEEGALAQALG
jgi:Phosphotransferase enzyme family